jgi:hypothetical protein
MTAGDTVRYRSPRGHHAHWIPARVVEVGKGRTLISTPRHRQAFWVPTEHLKSWKKANAKQIRR